MSENRSLTRSQQAERTRRMLFEKGCEILRVVDNFDDFAVEDITGACGVSKGTFYVHFKSKGAFFYNVKHALAREANAGLIEILEDTDRSARWALTQFVREWALCSKDTNIPISVDFLALVHHWYYPDEDSIAFAGELHPDHIKEMICAQLKEGVEHGEFRPDTPVDTVAGLMIVMLTGFAAFLHAQPEGTDLSMWADEAATMLDEGVLRRWLA